MNNFPSKLFYVVCTLIASLFMASFSYAASETATKQIDIPIGIYAPFANNKAYIGRHILGAMEMARDELKASKINYTFYTLDRNPENPEAAKILQKFIETHHIKVLVTEGAASGYMAAPVVKKNNILHFCLTNDARIADGKNNFVAFNADYGQVKVLDKEVKPEFIAQFRQMYKSHPVTEAGYAFDVFHILNKSAVIAQRNKPDFSSEKISDQVQVLASGIGMMGPFNMDKQGVLFAKAEIKTAQNKPVKHHSPA